MDLNSGQQCRFYAVRRIIVAAVILVSVFVSACRHIPVLGEWERLREQEQTKEADEAIRTLPEYQEINKFCNEIPKPESFVPVFKRRSFRKENPYLVFGYTSSMQFEDVRKLFLSLESTGWEIYDEWPSIRSQRIEFRKNRYRFGVEYFSEADHGNYLIVCQKMDE